MDLHFAFWNCALSPPGSNDMQSPDNMADAVDVIANLFTEKNIAFLALCEVNQQSFGQITNRLHAQGLKFSAQFMADETSAGGKFDIGYFCCSDRVTITHGVACKGKLGSSSIKIAQQLLLRINSFPSATIQILVSHWPARIFKISDNLRERCSIGLRNLVEDIINNKYPVILMGDYNDEPYSHSLFKNICATNDRTLVISQPDFWLYNPYWRTLAARMPFTMDEQQHDFGTCYSKSGNRNNWSAFDQIIFSGHFLSSGPWYLQESATGVALTDKLHAAITDNKHCFDHIPVIGCISNRESDNVSV